MDSNKITKYLLQAIKDTKEFEEDADEIRVRLYELEALQNSIHDLISAISESKQLTIEPQILFALSDVFNLMGEINEQ
tara:strand:- start:656 stop:889 length:234 start_codon:yes stop_codon:yes gene_type:complete